MTMFGSLVSGALAPLLVAQALYARRTIPRLPEPEGPRHGVAGTGPQRLALLVAGDSSAAGVGVDHQRDALAGPLAAELARLSPGRSVIWELQARSGLDTAQTGEWLKNSRSRADLAVIVTGVNDVVERHAPAQAVAARESLHQWLRVHAQVRHTVFLPLPPVQAFHGLPQPLRAFAGRQARRHDEALAKWVQQQPARELSLARVELPLQREFMARDGFHPGALAYRAWARQLALHLDRVASSLGL